MYGVNGLEKASPSTHPRHFKMELLFETTGGTTNVKNEYCCVCDKQKAVRVRQRDHMGVLSYKFLSRLFDLDHWGRRILSILKPLEEKGVRSREKETEQFKSAVLQF